MLVHRIRERSRGKSAFFKVKIEIPRIDFHLHSLMKTLSLNGLIINTTITSGKV